MTDAQELKPCPFCGGEARLVTHRTGEDSMGAYVYCKDCDAHSQHFEDAYAPASEAIAAWNTRADLTAAAVAAALQGAAKYHHDFLRDRTSLHLEKIFSSSEAILAHIDPTGLAALEAYADKVRAERIAELNEAYRLGFAASGEGYNQEYPFDQWNERPEQDEQWLRGRDANIATIRAMAKPAKEGGE